MPLHSDHCFYDDNVSKGLLEYSWKYVNKKCKQTASLFIYVYKTYGVVTDPCAEQPFMDEAEDGADEDVEDTEDEPTSLIALFLENKTAFLCEKKVSSNGLR